MISVELLGQLRQQGISIQTGPVLPPRGDSPDSNWRQVMKPVGDVEISSTTRIGNGPFDDASGQYRCPSGCVLGLNVLSEVVIAGEGLGGRHLALTRQCIGLRRGVLFPSPLIIVSREFREALQGPFGRRCRLEPVHHEDARAA